jgi:hypothetical protein
MKMGEGGGYCSRESEVIYSCYATVKQKCRASSIFLVMYSKISMAWMISLTWLVLPVRGFFFSLLS